MTGKRALFAAAIVAAAGMASYTPAQAAGQYDCNVGTACIWRDGSFGGNRFEYNLDVNSLHPYATWNDAASSAFNRMSVGTKLYTGLDCTGNGQVLTSGVAKSSLTYNDSTTSLDVYGQSACGI